MIPMDYAGAAQAAGKASIDRARDTGLALVLALLLLFRVWQQDALILAAIFVLLLTMAWPAAFKLPARLWFGLAGLMGVVSSTVLLSLVFALVLLPVAAIRGLAGADPMNRRRWKKDQASVFAQREHEFSAADLQNPY